MRESKPKNVSDRDKGGRSATGGTVKALKIGQIRLFVDELKALPKDGALPDWTHLSLGDRFAVAMRLIETGAREKVLGKSQKQLDRYGAGAEIPVLVLAALARQTELPIDWLLSGRPMGRAATQVSKVPGNHDVEDVALQKLAFRPSAGRGTLVFDDSADYVRFPRAILDRIGIKPAQARLMEADGLSMFPTINDRDMMVADISSTTLIEGKVYVFTIGDQVHVKRLRKGARGQVLMVSDNRELFPDPELVPEDQSFTIHARVEWVGRRL